MSQKFLVRVSFSAVLSPKARSESALHRDCGRIGSAIPSPGSQQRLKVPILCASACRSRSDDCPASRNWHRGGVQPWSGPIRTVSRATSRGMQTVAQKWTKSSKSSPGKGSDPIDQKWSASNGQFHGKELSVTAAKMDFVHKVAPSTGPGHGKPCRGESRTHHPPWVLAGRLGMTGPTPCPGPRGRRHR